MYPTYAPVTISRSPGNTSYLATYEYYATDLYANRELKQLAEKHTQRLHLLTEAFNRERNKNLLNPNISVKRLFEFIDESSTAIAEIPFEKLSVEFSKSGTIHISFIIDTDLQVMLTHYVDNPDIGITESIFSLYRGNTLIASGSVGIKVLMQDLKKVYTQE